MTGAPQPARRGLPWWFLALIAGLLALQAGGAVSTVIVIDHLGRQCQTR